MSANSIISPTAAAQLSNGAMQVFVVNRQGQLLTRWKVNVSPDSEWSDWSQFQNFPPGGNLKFVFAISLSDKRIQVWGIDDGGAMFSCWKKTTDINSDWTAWTPFATLGSSGTPTSMGGASLPNGAPQIFMTNVQGLVFTCWKGADSNSKWSEWVPF